MKLEEFWDHVDVRGPEECWPWLEGLFNDGYGCVAVPEVKSSPCRANRVAFFLQNNYWPEQSNHTCDYKLCCNPAHVYDGSQAQNMKDRSERRRNDCRGEKNPQAKLTDAQVEEIRQKYWSDPYRGHITALGAEYGVRHSQISRIIHGKRRTGEHRRREGT